MEDAARFNRSAGVTGVLLFDGQRFLQYMEGPADGLDVAFSRVSGARSHTELTELGRGRVGQRRLPFWPMRCLSVSASELQRIALADWCRFIQRAVTSQDEAEAMEKLLAIVEPYANAA
ncbi:BLUF domain-containing protein [Stenotrophomonas maltophilia]|uniref:BLUF domain-containing protein n=1 Tax=Stenotrophomonas maltophilia TaxID=40324 RepID=UPI001E42245A|nr:BLUF domain-containing protein [Stenotrophomonas maltophilia]